MKEIPTEVYSRVSGYFRPTRQWNKGKKSEFEERKYMRIPDEVLKPETFEEKTLKNTDALQKAGIFDKIFNNVKMERKH